jgi:hypothetical protein
VSSTPPAPETDVVVVGAGLAGLGAALRLHREGFSVRVVERADAVGGRVRTDEVDGFLLDRGFQVLLTAYPELDWAVEGDALDLCEFQPGALVALAGRLHRVGDPLRRPRDLPATLRAPIGSPLDKLRILRFRQQVTTGSLDDLLRRADTTAEERLRRVGFGPTLIDRFFRPLFGGIALDPTLQFSSRTLEFVFRMLARGTSAVPAGGMGRLPAHLAGRLPAGAVHLDAPVESVAAGSVTLAGGERVGARAVVVATGGDVAARLVGTPDPGWVGVTTIWFESPEPPVDEPVIVLDGDGLGPVTNLAVMSRVSSRYAPAGRHLVAASLPGTPADAEASARAQLARWFGAVVAEWATIRVDRIPHAQPARPPGYDPAPPVEVADGVVVAGDHRATASINGALASGRHAADAVVARLRR